MTDAQTVLVCDDDPVVRSLIGELLTAEGYRVVAVGTGGEAFEQVKTLRPVLALLDWWLPDIDGTEVCRRIRAEPSIAELPVIMVTTSARAEDVAFGFEVGADDYVIKPFRDAELIGRVRAVLRGRRRPSRPDVSVLRLGPLEVDVGAHEARIDGADIHLTATEFAIVRSLVSAMGVAQPRSKLVEEAIAPGVHITERTIDVHVRRIRQKLGAHADLIQTIRGVGYRAREDAP